MKTRPSEALSKDARRELLTLARHSLKRKTQMRAKIPAADRTTALPLSFAQQRLWFLAQLDPATSIAYHMSVGLRMRGALDRTALRTALDRIVTRHEVLRTTFAVRNGHPEQLIAPASTPFALGEQDLSALSSDALHSTLERICSQLATEPFDLAAGPLIRGQLLRVGPLEHVLLITQHHIISDGWSMGVLIRELIELYTAFCRSLPDPLPPLPLQYADYAAWQRQLLNADVLQQQLQFWREQLRGAPALLELPTDRPRPPAQSSRNASVYLSLPSALVERLTALGHQHGATLFMVLLTAFKGLLSRYSGEETIVVGTIVANRMHRTLESLIGLFLNTLPLCTGLAGDPSFLTLLARVRKVTLDAFANQDVPFEQLVADLKSPYNRTYAPIFQVMFELQNFPTHPLEVPGLSLTPMQIDTVSSKYDLIVRFARGAEGLSGTFEFATDLFNTTTVERLAAHFEVLLRGVVANPDLPLSQWPLLMPQELEAIRTPPPRRPHPPEFIPFSEQDLAAGSIVARFESQVRAFPTRPAVSDAHTTWTYLDLDQHANAIAGAIATRLGNANLNIPALIDRDVHAIALILGILKAGHCYVPLDAAMPEARRRLILSHCEAPLVACSAARPEGSSIGPTDLPVLNTAGLGCATTAPRAARTCNSHSYVIYTSGTTNTPKGIRQTDGSVLHFIAAYTNALLIRPADRLTMFAPLGFDAAVMDLWGALLNGASVHMYDVRGTGIDGLGDWLQRQRVTMWHSTPSALRMCAHVLRRTPCPSIRMVVLGGEEAFHLERQILNECFPPQCELVNGYGLTESSNTLQHFVTAADPPAHRIPIGRPVERTKVSLLAPNGRTTTLAGELAIHSRYVAPGYFADPVRTDSAFRAGTDPGERVYRTGDRVRYQTDGTLEFLGRIDRQVKIRGYRIEPAEIEAAMHSLPGIEHAAVTVAGSIPSERRLVAYFAPAQQMRVSVAELRRHLTERLPDYMVPRAFVELRELPLTPNGKLDRNALPAPPAVADSAAGGAPPVGPLEVRLAQIWQQVLAVAPIGRDADFFELGGDSMRAVTLMMAINAALGTEVALRTVFQHPTIHALSDWIRTQDTLMPGETAGRPSHFETGTI